jgi:3-hydroxyisobutyrate dehydrogenase-like beta-hydroxyacid dehydrogenase
MVSIEQNSRYLSNRRHKARIAVMTTTASQPTAVTVLGMGAMGRALAEALVAAGHPTTVWNRSPARARALADRATVAATIERAVQASPLVVACLLDHASVHEVLDPVAAQLSGRSLVNVTTTTPAEARELAAWAAEQGVAYLDGGIMATPEMIGGRGSAVLYSGSAEVFDDHRALLDLWGESSYFGPDAGIASLWDLALLSGMYLMFAGFLQGAAMVGSEGVSARELAARATPFLQATAAAFAGIAEVIDTADYAGEGHQSLEFTDLSRLLDATRDQGVSTELIAPVQALIERQIAAGHGKEAFERIYEEIRSQPA